MTNFWRAGLLTVAFSLQAFARGKQPYPAETCRLALQITIEDISYRLLDPTPDHDRARRAFQQLATIDDKCSSVKTQVVIGDCEGMALASRNLSLLPKRGVAAYERITSCKLFGPGTSKPASARSTRIPALITQTLSEQQVGDGEASYWIANDLLALFIVCPEDMLKELELSPSFTKSFVAGMGGKALEDLDDREQAAHTGVQRKTRVLAVLLRGLRARTAPESKRMQIISEIARSCGCEPGSPSGKEVPGNSTKH